MAVLLANATAQKIDFGSPSSIFGLHQKTWVIWFIKTANATFGMITNLAPNSVTVDNNWAVYNTSAGWVRFQYPWTTSVSNVAIWLTPVLSLNTLYNLIITYDDSSTSNKPLMYVNGISVSVTDSNTPSGVVPSGTNSTLRVGASAATNPVDGTVFSSLVYNRIFSAAEASDAYNSKLAIPTYNGLVFAPQLWGCASSVAEGATMSSSNTVLDIANMSTGTPANSPVYKGDTILTFQS